MSSICFYFQVHQPLRLKRFSVFDIGKGEGYFSEGSDDALDNLKILKKVARKCYLPANKTFLELLQKHPEFKISFSISGVFIDQLESDMPEVLESFKGLVKTGHVELLCETYYHSLSFIYSKDEFVRQVELHREKMKNIFGFEPKVFRNTELIYNNHLAQEVEKLGFKGILLEGADHILKDKSPNFVYRAKGTNDVKLLLRNYKLSDDISFRFSTHDWEEFPLDAGKFSTWASAVNGSGDIINLFMDYETFGEHQWESTGIFNFLNDLPAALLKHPDNDFVTPSEAIERYQPREEVDVENFASWADVERDLSAWLSNPMQHDAMKKLYELEKRVLAADDPDLILDWRRLQTSDHFYYMCTKWFADGDVHKYFNPYDSPYEAFISYMNVLGDLKLRLKTASKKNKSMITSNRIRKGAKSDSKAKK